MCLFIRCIIAEIMSIVCNATIETNSRPKSNVKNFYSLWRSNRIAVHNFSKTSFGFQTELQHIIFLKHLYCMLWLQYMITILHVLSMTELILKGKITREPINLTHYYLVSPIYTPWKHDLFKGYKNATLDRNG